tara:strand:- start:660 stop:1568 length:909 start_codon:yes stop_codon:yes gene_type:complete
MFHLKIKNTHFNSPIIAASGTFGYGNEIEGAIDYSKIGCIITKSITFEERIGNLNPRIIEAGNGMLNAIGLANVGVEKFCKNKMPSLNKLPTNYMISVAGSKKSDYQRVIEYIENNGGNHIGYEINVSCPNVKEGGIEFGVNKEILSDLTSNLRDLTRKLLFIKLSPNVTNIEELALAVQNAGADGVSAINTFIGMAIDYKTGQFSLSNIYGGLSGPAIKPLALAKIHKIYNLVNIPIFGMGGISNYKDIIEFLRVGSSMVQVGTLNYRDPFIICKFYDDLLKYSKDNKIDSLSCLTGDFKI